MCMPSNPTGHMTHIPYEISGAQRQSRWIVTCDHATNIVPDWINEGDLGLPPEDMDRHIAYDIGAEGLALALGAALEAPVIASRFSRLVIDPNRGIQDPTLVMRLYDGTIIPANRHVDANDISQRIDRLYAPYHSALGDLAAAQSNRVIVSVHSFTKQLRGRGTRPWHIGVLHAPADSRLALPFIDRLKQEGDLCVGNNEPYLGHLPGDAIDRHALQTGRPNVLIEVRNDLIETTADQNAWAARLAPMLIATLASTGL